MRKVMLFGTFHIIHPGHLSLFRQAKKFGERLYVVLARDETVARLKGYQPKAESERMAALKKIPLIDEVILGDFTDRFKAIKDIRPDVICLGYDQEFFIKELEAFLLDSGMDIIIERLSPYKPHIYKSTKLRLKGTQG